MRASPTPPLGPVAGEKSILWTPGLHSRSHRFGASKGLTVGYRRQLPFWLPYAQPTWSWSWPVGNPPLDSQWAGEKAQEVLASPRTVLGKLRDPSDLQRPSRARRWCLLSTSPFASRRALRSCIMRGSGSRKLDGTLATQPGTAHEAILAPCVPGACWAHARTRQRCNRDLTCSGGDLDPGRGGTGRGTLRRGVPRKRAVPGLIEQSREIACSRAVRTSFGRETTSFRGGATEY